MHLHQCWLLKENTVEILIYANIKIWDRAFGKFFFWIFAINNTFARIIKDILHQFPELQKSSLQ